MSRSEHSLSFASMHVMHGPLTCLAVKALMITCKGHAENHRGGGGGGEEEVNARLRSWKNQKQNPAGFTGRKRGRGTVC